VSYRSLDADEIERTIEVLKKRIHRRFPDSGLEQVNDGLLSICQDTKKNLAFIEQRHWLLRTAIGIITLLLFGIIAILVYMFVTNSFGNMVTASSLSDFFQGTDAALNIIVLLGASLFFLVTIERRIKRHRALKVLNELRSLAHVVDMHQLTKDPDRMFNKSAYPPVKRKMTPFELQRYLDYCTEILSLTGKVAALYNTNFDDEIVLNVVNDIEDLTTGLSRKIWQKIMIVHMYSSQKKFNALG
jgi:hypothetical protein